MRILAAVFGTTQSLRVGVKVSLQKQILKFVLKFLGSSPKRRVTPSFPVFAALFVAKRQLQMCLAVYQNDISP